MLGGLLVMGLQVWQLTGCLLPRLERLRLVLHRLGHAQHRADPARTYWLETNLAREHRLRRDMATDGGIATSSSPTARLFRVSVEGCAYFWGFTALVGTLFWVLYYVL